ncbi:MAG: dihydrofolate reductase family protein [Nitrososphaerales archaeon]
MAKLIYIANASLDGYTEDRDGGIDWGTPDEEYFSSINGLLQPVGTYLYGRRMYEAMVYWETAPIADQPAWVVDFTNIWRAGAKVVFSR